MRAWGGTPADLKIVSEIAEMADKNKIYCQAQNINE